MSKVLNLHRLATNNIGDLKCAPYLYFQELLGNNSRDILGFRSADEPDAERRSTFHTDFANADTIVIGGGGLLEIDFFNPAFDYIMEKHDPARQRLVIWGAGHNAWTIGDWRKLKQSFSFPREAFALCGVRDDGYDLSWVPCVSCMSPLLQKDYEIKRDIGVYIHSATMKNENLYSRIPENYEVLTNSATFEEAIDFLGQSELVLTDSFHGAYWATLLGRRVIAFPSSSKFYSLRHPVPLCDVGDWPRMRSLARPYPDALDECRSATIEFSRKVAALMS